MTTAHLKRELSAIKLFTLGFGSIIGVGWMILVGDWLSSAGLLGAMLAFMIGGFSLAIIGLCYCEAATRFPVAGGEISYCFNLFGVREAFAVGWILVLAFTVGTAFEAIAIGWLLSVMLPGISGPVLFSVWGEDVYLGRLLIGLILMVVVALINLRGIKVASFVQDMITYGLLALTIVCVAVALWNGDSSNLYPLFGTADGTDPVAGFLGVLAMTPLFYLGFNVIPQALGERSESVGAGQVSAAILAAILGAIVFYVLVIIMTAISLPRAELLAQEQAAYAAVAAAFGSPGMGNLILIAGLLGLISSWNAIFYAATRALMVLARIGTIPDKYATLHPRYGTPKNAIILVAVIGGACTFLGSAALVPMINALGSAMTIVFATIALGIFRTPLPEGAKAFLKGGFDRFVPALALLISLSLFFIGMNQAWVSTSEGIPPEWQMLVVWVLLGLFFWWSARHTRRRISDTERRRILLDDSEDDGKSDSEMSQSLNHSVQD